MQTIVITGASTGIGKACALALDRKNFRVFAGVRKPEDGEALQAKASENLTPLYLDITEPEAIQAAVQQVAGVVGDAGIQGLVNNAGIVVMGPLEFLPLDEMRQQFEVNFFGQLTVTQAFLPLLRAGQGRVLNMSSTGGRFATPFLGPYHASKFALEALSDSMRMELAPWGLDVIVIEPASIATPIWEKSLKKAQADLQTLSPDAQAKYGKIIQNMMATVQDVGEIGISVEEVVKRVHHALTAKKPRTRYLIGMSRLRYFLATIIPDRWRDRVILRTANIKPGAGSAQ